MKDSCPRVLSWLGGSRETNNSNCAPNLALLIISGPHLNTLRVVQSIVCIKVEIDTGYLDWIDIFFIDVDTDTRLEHLKLGLVL